MPTSYPEYCRLNAKPKRSSLLASQGSYSAKQLLVLSKMFLGFDNALDLRRRLADDPVTLAEGLRQGDVAVLTEHFEAHGVRLTVLPFEGVVERRYLNNKEKWCLVDALPGYEEHEIDLVGSYRLYEIDRQHRRLEHRLEGDWDELVNCWLEIDELPAADYPLIHHLCPEHYGESFDVFGSAVISGWARMVSLGSLSSWVLPASVVNEVRRLMGEGLVIDAPQVHGLAEAFRASASRGHGLWFELFVTGSEPLTVQIFDSSLRGPLQVVIENAPSGLPKSGYRGAKWVSAGHTWRDQYRLAYQLWEGGLDCRVERAGPATDCPPEYEFDSCLELSYD